MPASGSGTWVPTYDQSSGIVTLTQDSGYQVGNMAMTGKISLSSPFTLNTEINLGNKSTGSGADGIGFVFYNGMPRQLGDSGNSLGIGGVANAIGFRLDTFNNTPGEPLVDPAEARENGATYGGFITTDASGKIRKDANNVMYVADLALIPNANFQPQQNYSDGKLHPFVIQYDGKGNLSISLAKDTVTMGETIPDGQVTNADYSKFVWKVNIYDYAAENGITLTKNSSLSMGVTGSTGGAMNLQQLQFLGMNYDPYAKIPVTDRTTNKKTISNQINLKGMDSDSATVKVQSTNNANDRQPSDVSDISLANITTDSSGNISADLNFTLAASGMKKFYDEDDVHMIVTVTDKNGNSVNYYFDLYEPINTWMPDQNLQKEVLHDLDTKQRHAEYNALTPKTFTNPGGSGFASVSDITKSSLSVLTFIDPSAHGITGITNITGLEFAKNLGSMCLENQSSLKLDTKTGLAGWLHTWIPQFSKLQELNFANDALGTQEKTNNLDSTLPSDGQNSSLFKISDLKTLTNISVENNGLTGKLPAGWSMLTNLITLSLRSNQFTDVIPDSWLDLTNITFFNASSNQLMNGFLRESSSTEDQVLFKDNPLAFQKNGNNAAMIPLNDFYRGLLGKLAADGASIDYSNLKITQKTAYKDIEIDPTTHAIVIPDITKFLIDNGGVSAEQAAPVFTVTDSGTGTTYSSTVYTKLAFDYSAPITINYIDAANDQVLKTQQIIGVVGDSYPDLAKTYGLPFTWQDGDGTSHYYRYVGEASSDVPSAYVKAPTIDPTTASWSGTYGDNQPTSVNLYYRDNGSFLKLDVNKLDFGLQKTSYSKTFEYPNQNASGNTITVEDYRTTDGNYGNYTVTAQLGNFKNQSNEVGLQQSVLEYNTASSDQSSAMLTSGGEAVQIYANDQVPATHTSSVTYRQVLLKVPPVSTDNTINPGSQHQIDKISQYTATETFTLTNSLN